MAQTDKKKSCFVVGQIGADDSPARIHADWVLEEIIMPVMSDFPDFKVVRADKVTTPGLIDTQIISHLLSAELVIADLTGLNPNAFYEIGIRHVVQKPIIHMHLAEVQIPFDVSLFRSLRFSLRRPADIKLARSGLREMVLTVLAPEHEVENPVTAARGRIRFDETATAPDKLLREEIDGVKERLKWLEGQSFESLTPTYPGEGPSIDSGPGDRVVHHKFGPGVVVHRDEHKLTVDFERVGRKRVLDSFLNKA
jgi:hypothetical protein